MTEGWGSTISDMPHVQDVHVHVGVNYAQNVYAVLTIKGQPHP